jgi:hypothetical protein
MAPMKFFTSIESNSKFWYLLPVICLFFVLYRGRAALYLYQQIYSPKLEYARYQNSAYFQGDTADYILSDEQVNVIRGVEQLIIKKDPLQTLPGHPFLASYLYGLSVIIFQNPYFASLFAFTLSVIFFLLIAQKITGKTSTITILTSLLILDPLFNEAIFTTMLDIYLLLFSLVSLYFLLCFYERKKIRDALISSLFLGFCVSTKFYPATLPLMGTFVLTTVFKKDFSLFKKHLISLPMILLGFAIGHFTFFAYHLDLLAFVRYQRFIQNWWAGSPSVEPFIVFGIIFQNQWHTWWDKKEVIRLEYWSPVWGLLLLSSLTLLNKLKNPNSVIFIFWILLSFVMFSFMAIYPRHLLAVLPALYLSFLLPKKTRAL